MRYLSTFFIYLSFLCLCAYGLLFVYSSTIPISAEGENLGFTFSPQLKKQCLFYLLGFIFLIIFSRIPYRRWSRVSFILFMINIVLLILLFFVGSKFGGARSWFAIGPFRFQPSETMKILWVLYMSTYLIYRKSFRQFSGLMVPFFFTAIPVLLILRQPDLGTAFVFIPSVFIMLYFVGARKRHLFAVFLMFVIMAIPMWMFFMKDYQKMRIMAFLDPSAYARTSAYSLNHSLLAIGEGHWFGKGLGKGEVNRLSLLPEKHTDFIFSIIAEELGLIGAMGLVLCYTTLFASFFIIAYFTREPFGKTMVIGITAILLTQTLTNIGVALGVLPTTGITLPFISAGGSSIVACSFMIALVLSVSRHHVTVLSKEDFEN